MFSVYFVFASMGRIGTFKSKLIYECNDKKIDFVKAIVHLKDFHTNKNQYLQHIDLCHITQHAYQIRKIVVS